MKTLTLTLEQIFMSQQKGLGFTESQEVLVLWVLRAGFERTLNPRVGSSFAEYLWDL
jgi:hypothetical protein